MISASKNGSMWAGRTWVTELLWKLSFVIQEFIQGWDMLRLSDRGRGMDERWDPLKKKDNFRGRET